jgi:pyruvate-ferredoxin/flavodoxin oxidoreductase
MQTCFFYISGVLPHDEAVGYIKDSIKQSYGKKDPSVVELNFNAVDATIEHLYHVEIPKEVSSDIPLQPAIKGQVNHFIADVTAMLIEGKGDDIPVSKMPADGTWPSGTTQYQKRNLAQEIPVWEPELCTQCNKCVLVCPHAVIRSKVVEGDELTQAPENFFTLPAKGKAFEEDEHYTLQVAVEDCTGCALCVDICPATDKEDPFTKAINMKPQLPRREEGIENWDFFMNLSDFDRSKLNHAKVKDSQFLEPLFEFSGACPGCTGGDAPASGVFVTLGGIGRGDGCGRCAQRRQGMGPYQGAQLTAAGQSGNLAWTCSRL